MSETSQPVRIRLVLLALGAAAGILLAVSGLVQSWSLSSGSLPDNAIARVGERVILQQRYLELLNDLASDKRMPLSASDRRFALDRLIDEELLIMRGIELGLPETSPEIRKTIAAAVISHVAAEAEAAPPDEEALRRLYESDSAYFTTAARYRLRWWRMPGSDEDAKHRATSAYNQLSSNTPIGAVTESTGLQPEPLLPDQMLPLSKLTDYLGPMLAQQASKLQPGEFSRPVAVGDNMNILYLLAKQDAVLPDFERARPMVEAEYLRRSGDEALRRYLAWLRERAEIIVAPENAQ